MNAHDNTRIANKRPLLPPAILIEELPLREKAKSIVAKGRSESSDILHGKDDRLTVICGPCSIHDPNAALEYAQELKKLADRYETELQVIMRT